MSPDFIRLPILQIEKNEHCILAYVTWLMSTFANKVPAITYLISYENEISHHSLSLSLSLSWIFFTVSLEVYIYIYIKREKETDRETKIL